MTIQVIKKTKTTSRQKTYQTDGNYYRTSNSGLIYKLKSRNQRRNLKKALLKVLCDDNKWRYISKSRVEII